MTSGDLGEAKQALSCGHQARCAWLTNEYKDEDEQALHASDPPSCSGLFGQTHAPRLVQDPSDQLIGRRYQCGGRSNDQHHAPQVQRNHEVGRIQLSGWDISYEGCWTRSGPRPLMTKNPTKTKAARINIAAFLPHPKPSTTAAQTKGPTIVPNLPTVA